MHRAALLLAILAVSVVALPLGSAGSADVAQNDSRDVSTRAEITLGTNQSPDATGFTVTYISSYEARSAAEARRARNGTLDISWFQGDEAMEATHAKYPGADVRINDPDIGLLDSGGAHGSVQVLSSIAVDGVWANGRDRVTFGPTMAEYLRPGDRLVLVRPGDWNPTNTSLDGRSTRGERQEHVWTIGEEPEPYFVLEKSSTEQDTGPLGSGPIVPVVAVALLAALLAAGSKFRD